MILVDANVLVYAYVTDFVQHAPAKAWLDERMSSSVRVGLPWESVVAFLRLVTNPRVFERPASPAAAWTQASAWLDAPPSWIPVPTEGHRVTLERLIGDAKPTANLVHDAHLAALALDHGLAVASTDGDFARFRGVRWIDPLAD